MLPLRFSQRNSTGCQNATLNQFFLELSLLWEGALCFFFDLTKVFLQGGAMPPLNHQSFWICHYFGKGHYASASTNQGISLGFHRARPTIKKFRLFIIVGRVHYASAST